MKSHHTKIKGNLAVLKVKADSYQQGWLPLQPESEHEPFDIVLYKSGKFLRVQVKYSKMNSDGTIQANLRSTWADKNGSHVKLCDRNEVDLFAIYCEANDSCYYIKTEDIKTKTTLYLRIEGSGNASSLFGKNFTQI